MKLVEEVRQRKHDCINYSRCQPTLTLLTPHPLPFCLSVSSLSRLNIFGDFWVILTHFILGAEYADQALEVNLDYTFFPVHKVFLPYFSVFVNRIKHMLINFLILLPNK